MCITLTQSVNVNDIRKIFVGTTIKSTNSNTNSNNYYLLVYVKQLFASVCLYSYHYLYQNVNMNICILNNGNTNTILKYSFIRGIRTSKVVFALA